MTLKQKIHHYIITHDRRWSFILAYVSLAVVLAIVINLFWLAAVVAVHGLFEWIKQSALVEDRWARFFRVMWELKFDIGLVIFGLALEVYIGVLLGIAGLGATARAGVEAGSRAAMWQSVLRGTLLSVDDAALVARMATGTDEEGEDQGEDGAIEEMEGLEGDEVDQLFEPEQGPTDLKGRLGPWAEKWVLGDWLSLGFGLTCLALILVGPWLTPHDWGSILAMIGEEMHPMPWLVE